MKKESKNLKVAIYIKSNEQSIQNQFVKDKKWVLQYYAKTRGFYNIDKFYIDEKDSEKELRCLMKDIKNKNIDVIVVNSIEDFAENIVDIKDFIEKVLEKNNVRYISCIESIDSNEDNIIRRYYKNLFNFINAEEKEFRKVRNRKIKEMNKKYAV